MNKPILFKKMSLALTLVIIVAGVIQQGCLVSPTDSPPIVGNWTCTARSDVKAGIIYHNSSAYPSTQAETTFIENDLSGVSLNFLSGGDVEAKFLFFNTPLTLPGTWTYSDTDANLSMVIPGTSVWPETRSGKLVVSGNEATITYMLAVDTLSHGISTFGTKSDTTSEVFIGTEVITLTK
jgi:hypothetical protein